jgi:pimeloyl-ACP methyl ester carboxylesterase
MRKPLFGLVLPLAGCTLLLPQNVDENPSPTRAVLKEAADAALFMEDGFTDGYWLEVERGSEPGRLGGYLSQPASPREALVLVLGGASSFEPRGALDCTRYTHTYFLPRFEERQFRIWTLVRRECGTPYGGDDVRDVIQALDWLEREGKSWLGVERVYLYGYSTGATQATLASRQRQVTAVVSLAGLTRPNQFEDLNGFYWFLAGMFPNNTGICQLRDTLAAYGPPGAAAWDALNTVDHLDELRSPMLLAQGSEDPIYFNANLLELRARYQADLAAGASLAPLEFIYLSGVNHYELPEHPEVVRRTMEFLERFEP